MIQKDPQKVSLEILKKKEEPQLKDEQDEQDFELKKKKEPKNISNEKNLSKLGTYTISRQEDLSIDFDEYIRIFFVGFFFSFFYITIDNKKRYGLFLIGCSTIILVCLVMSLLQNAMVKTPLIFLKISEDTTGETDFYLLPKFINESQNPLLNFTKIEELLHTNEPDHPYITGISPRWLINGIISNRDNPEKDTNVMILITDTEREENMGMGRAWPHRPLGEFEVHVRNSVLWTIDLEPRKGQRCMIKLDFDSIMKGVSGESIAQEQGVYEEEEDGGGGGGISQDDFRSFLEGTLGGDTEDEGDNSTVVFNVTGLGLSQDVLDLLGIENNQIDIGITTNELIDGLINATTTDDGTVEINLEAEYIVIDSVSKNWGKYPSSFGDLVVIDSKYLNNMLQEMIENEPNIGTMISLLGVSDNFTINWLENVFGVAGMYKQRFSTYRKRDDPKDEALIDFTDYIMNNLGVEYPIDLQLPTNDGLAMMGFFNLFLDQIFLGITVCLSALGIILIFALLLANVEEKTYEYGMLRAMGLQQPALVQMIFVQGFFFAIPGVILAMGVGYPLNLFVEFFFWYFIRMPSYDFTLSLDSIIIPVCIGLTIPIIANLIPVRTALSKSLRNSLDVVRQSFSETKITFTKLENLGLEPWQTTLAILMITFGFVVYYLMPLAFIFREMRIFFYTLEGIFIGMLAGLCVMAVILEPFVERIILEVVLFFNFCFPKDRRMKTLIIKNLAGHRSRSRKAFLMFTLSVGFIVYAGVNFSQLMTTISGNMGLLVGSHLQIIETGGAQRNMASDELVSFLDEQKKIGNITSYAFLSSIFDEFPWVSETKFSNLAIYPREPIAIYGIDQNYLEATFSDYFIPTETNNGIKANKLGIRDDLIDSLYINKGKASVSGLKEDYYPDIIFSGRKTNVEIEEWDNYDPMTYYDDHYDIVFSEGMRDLYGVDANSAVLLNVRLMDGYYDKVIAKPHGMIRKCPGFFFSSYTIGAFYSPVLLTFEQYHTLANRTSNTYSKRNPVAKQGELYKGFVPKRTLFVKLPGENEARHRNQFVNRLKVLTDPDTTIIMDVELFLKNARGSYIGFTALFYMGGTLALIFCTYMLALSFISNVRDSSWEFGVLRAIGFTAKSLVRAYIYEAMILVIAAFGLGTLVGCIIGASLIAQFNLFLEMPFFFDFPFDMVFGLLGIAIILAILGSYFPARVIKKREIAQVLRSID